MTAEAELKDALIAVKSPGRSAVVDNAPVEALVGEIVAAVSARGDAAVREYAAKFDKSDLERFEVSAEERAAAVEALDPRHARGHGVRDRQRPSVRRGAARDGGRARGGAAARRAHGSPGDPDRAGRGLCAGRALSAAVGADHDDRAGQGRRRRRGGRLPAAERASGDGGRVPSVRGGSDLPDRRGAGDRGDGLRDRERAEGRQDRRAGERLRQRGEAAGVRAGGNRPAGRAVGDLRPGRRDRRRGDDRDRPARAGGA